MEHEFVPGKRRCRLCSLKFDDRNGFGCLDPSLDPPEPLVASGPLFSGPEPEPTPQVWHLNVWTSVNGVIFTGSHQYSGPNVPGWAQTEAVNKVKEIVAGYTAKEPE